MSIEQLEEVKKCFEFYNAGKATNGVMDKENAIRMMSYFMLDTIKLFKELTKNIDDRWREYTYYDETLKELNKNIKKLQAKVRILEQQQTYYPFSEEELIKEGIGGTD